MTDLSALASPAANQRANSMTERPADTTTKDPGSLDLNDFLQLMVAQFQNQDIDNTASTSDMLNQLVQMSVVQAISEISTLIGDATVMLYSSSLVGKDVTVGQYVDGELEEIYGTVTGTGTLKGQQVIFVNGETYLLSDIMAIGKLPPGDEPGDPGDGGGVDPTPPPDDTDPVEPPEETPGAGDGGDTGDTGDGSDGGESGGEPEI